MIIQKDNDKLKPKGSPILQGIIGGEGYEDYIKKLELIHIEEVRKYKDTLNTFEQILHKINALKK